MRLLLISALCLFSSFTQANTQLPNGPHISVTGDAKVMALPDLAVVHFRLESIKSSSLEAKRDVDHRVNQFLAGIESFGVTSDDVVASRISTQPRYNYNRGERAEIDGYAAHRTLKVTLSRLKQLNDFLDFALSVKVNAIENIELKSSKAAEFKQQAIALAIKKAKQKGAELAQGFDASLGKVYSINSSQHSNFARFGENRRVQTVEMSADYAQKSQPGQYLHENIIFSANVSAVFHLSF